MITATKLYNYLQCPHKVWRDQYGPKEQLIEEVNPFVELLWQKGIQHEEQVLESLGDYLDLSQGTLDARELRTTEAIDSKTPLIYQGVIKADDLVGIPDILLLDNDIYYPVDIKSGMGLEGVSSDELEEGKPKRSYAVQLALYLDILQRIGLIDHKFGYIIDSSSDKMSYDLESAIGKSSSKSYWTFYEEILENVRSLVNNEYENKPALSSKCKLCGWYESCKSWAKETNDLTQLYKCGRKARDTINADLDITKVGDMIDISVNDLLTRKKGDKEFLKGIGKKTLESLSIRAKLFEYQLEPIFHKKFEFPDVEYEIFFDIEDDPTQEFVYMHGIYERSSNGERFVHFTAMDVSPIEEKRAWAEFWVYIKKISAHGYAIYYYSHRERTTYLKLQKKYPDVISEQEVIDFFAQYNVIDLYRIIDSSTDWPVGSYSLKELATYSGFKWRDETPSGALSIQWFNKYIETKDEKTLQRILEYNEDDCKATMVVKDKLCKSENYQS